MSNYFWSTGVCQTIEKKARGISMCCMLANATTVEMVCLTHVDQRRIDFYYMTCCRKISFGSTSHFSGLKQTLYSLCVEKIGLYCVHTHICVSTQMHFCRCNSSYHIVSFALKLYGHVIHFQNRNVTNEDV